jgi:hypothetical protein
MHPVVRSPHGDQRPAEIAQGRLTGLPRVRLAHDDPEPPPVLQAADCLSAVFVVADTELRLVAHLDLGDHRADRRIPARELDPRCLADDAPSAVAADEIPRPQRPAVGGLDLDAGVVLREAHHFPSAMDRHGQFGDPTGQDLLERFCSSPSR